MFFNRKPGDFASGMMRRAHQQQSDALLRACPRSCSWDSRTTRAQSEFVRSLSPGLGSLVVSPNRLPKLAVILKPRTLLSFHEPLKKSKYRLLFSSRGHRAGIGDRAIRRIAVTSSKELAHLPAKPGAWNRDDQPWRSASDVRPASYSRQRVDRTGCPVSHQFAEWHLLQAYRPPGEVAHTQLCNIKQFPPFGFTVA